MNKLHKTILVAVVMLAACSPGVRSPGSTTTSGQVSGTVTRVVDGDSIEVRNTAGQLTVRLDGINAPDSGECYHQEATERLRSLVANRSISLGITGEDQFGRVLAHVWEGSLHINLDQVATGHAIATTPLAARFVEAESAAVRGGLGLWSSTACGSGTIPDIEIDMNRSVVDPPGADEQVLDNEVIFLVNVGAETVDLSGWILRDESSRHRYHFATGTTVAAGQSIAVRSSDDGWIPGGSPVWNNNGDIIMLLDTSGRVVAVRRY